VTSMFGEWASTSTPYVTTREGDVGDAWAEEAAQHGGVGTHRLVEVTEVPADRRVAALLGLEAGDLVVVRRRVMLLDDQPVELTDSYYPTGIARGTRLAEQRKIRGGAVTLLAELGHRIDQVREDVSARNATAEEREQLELGDGPVLVLVRQSLSAGVPVEVSVMRMAPSRHLRYELSA
jgi:GntR family transcriptional regulator